MRPVNQILAKSLETAVVKGDAVNVMKLLREARTSTPNPLPAILRRNFRMPGSARKDRYTTTYLELALFGCSTHNKEAMTKIIKCLLLAGADANEHNLDANRDKDSVLHCAVQRGLVDCAKLLLDHGAIADIEVLRAAVNAVPDHGMKLVRLLIEYGASPNYIVRATGMPSNLLYDACIIWCCVPCQVEAVSALVAAGADVNIRSVPNGITPLMCVRQVEVAKVLIDFGADVFARDNGGLTVEDHAKENGSEEVAALIKQTMEDIENELPPLERVGWSSINT